MTVAFSTSSQQASVALLSLEGEVLWSGRRIAPHAASGACLSLLREGLAATALSLKDASLFVADLGPGSFTGVRVGVTLAKTLAYIGGVFTSGANAFDLIDAQQTVALPSKRNEWFVRRVGQSPFKTALLPEEVFVGFGPDLPEQTYPDAAQFSALFGNLSPVAPERLIPGYLSEPSISQPKRPFGVGFAP